MKIVKVICSTILFLILISVISLAVVYWKANKETRVLTDKDRQGTPGNYINLSLGVTHYQLTGPDTGEVIILIHGFSVPYYIWDANYNYLVNHGFRVLRYDLYGRGYSDRPDVVYNNAIYENQLLDLIKQLHLKTPANIIGVSFGALVAANFTSAHPELVNKVVLIDPAFKRPAPNQPQMVTNYYEATHGDNRANGQLTDFKYPARYPDWISKYRVEMQYKGFRNSLVSTMYHYDYKRKRAFAQLNATNKKVLLIWGSDDHTVPFTYSDSVRSVLKCDFFPIDDAAHLPNIEQAGKVNDRLVSFFRGR
jgi:pimeloyl-ACP methyl ester carboxylesterase